MHIFIYLFIFKSPFICKIVMSFQTETQGFVKHLPLDLIKQPDRYLF